MSHENVEVVRNMLDAFNRGDVDAVLGTFDERCELHEPPEMPDRPALGFRGHDGIREWMAKLRGIARVRFEPRSFTTSGDVMSPNGPRRVAERRAGCPLSGRPSWCCAYMAARSPGRRASASRATFRLRTHYSLRGPGLDPDGLADLDRARLLVAAVGASDR
jgi:ketosteroid isomerase-like protein